MKTGILTFHKAINLGAALQSAALQQYISDNICECEIIDFLPNNAVPADRGAVLNAAAAVKRRLAAVADLLLDGRRTKFGRFWRKNYRLSAQTYYGDRALEKAPPRYDVVISGSDQILNTTLSGVSESYYLKPWDSSVRKISYASSFGRTDLTAEEYRLIRQELPKFEALSAREATGAQIIARETGKETAVVLDPVFLLTRAQWEEKCAKSQTDGPYILAYAMEYSQAMERLITARIQEGRKVFLICGSGSASRLPGERVKNVGPAEFLSYIAHAESVITNSFHGVSMSLIFEKNFYAVAHSTRNARLEAILTAVGQKDKLIDSEDQCRTAEAVNGAVSYPMLEGSIIQSKEYLRRNLA